MKAGYEVAVYNRTKSKAEDVVAEGALWCDTVAQCAAGRDVVISIVGYPKDVEEVYFGEGGVIAHADPGTCVIDMTTTSPKLAVRIYENARKKGLKALDAPVTGGDTGAKAGTLTILVGGDQEAFETCLPVFEAMGKNIRYEGKAGNGRHTKMCNQIATAGSAQRRLRSHCLRQGRGPGSPGYAGLYQHRSGGQRPVEQRCLQNSQGRLRPRVLHQALHQRYEAGFRGGRGRRRKAGRAGLCAGHVPGSGNGRAWRFRNTGTD